ncbi:MAG: glutamine-hydrolyzing carbamoyl-phosphate synthase small subunit [Chlamydiota bacterium]|nr:glutamine-hydrolyzing carbamoyl-phosphate synthase small subunit [Chlamydiota bacterium]
MPSWVPSAIILEDGEKFSGYCPEWNRGTFYGEVVFTTGMMGYPETLTDPSYAGQILCFTYPLIGNYGIPPKELWESKKIHARGVIVSEACLHFYHHQGTLTFIEWLHSQNVPLIVGVDTRALTKVLRSSGTMLGAITTEKKDKYDFENPNEEHLVSQVSIDDIDVHKNTNSKKVVYAIDCGMKENIARSLKNMPIEVRRVPYNHDFTDEDFDGVFISNGPGDPEMCPETVAIIEKVMKKGKPIFGICLGIQIMSLAAGAKTYKLPFGHRGHNQPCIDTVSQKCYITSQNHGYAVNESSLPKGWSVTYRNLNDNSVAGIAHKTKPFFAVQFHPEATPGPTDTHWLFEKFYEML